MFGLYRDYRLGVSDVFSLVMVGLLALAAIAIALSATTQFHPGMLGLAVVVLLILLFIMICGV